MADILGTLPFDWRPVAIYGFYLTVSIFVFVVFYYSFKTNWSSLIAAVKGAGIVVLFALPFYGYSIIDALQLNYRGKEMAGIRVLSPFPAPEGVVISHGGCGALCQELLLEDHVRFVELARSGLVTIFGVNPPARFEKIAGRDRCEEARANATPAKDMNLNSTGLVALDPKFLGAAALDHCIGFVVIDELTAPVVIHTWPKEGPHVPIYLGNSGTVHHDIYRRGTNLEIAEMLARSESAWVDVVDFPPRLRIPDPPETGLSYSLRLSYGAPPLTELVNRTLSLDIDGRLDFSAEATSMLLANLRAADDARRIAAAAALRDLATQRAGAGSPKAPGQMADGAASQDGEALDSAWIQPLVAALNDENPSVRSSAAEAIGAYGPLAQTAVPALIDKLGQDDHQIRLRVVDALGAIGPAARDALPALRAAMNGKPQADFVAAIERIEGKRAQP